MSPAWILCLLCLFLVPCDAQETCYPPGGVAGIVVATIIVTFVVGALGAAIAYKVWTRKKGHRITERVNNHHGKSNQKTPDYAFDNPYFRDPEAAEDGDQTDKSKTRSSMTNKNSLRSSKQSDLSSKSKKTRSGKNHFMFGGGGGGKKHRAMDDSCLAVEPERTIVSLRGHDFTGLGFNICGNIRDGILVKDVLHRGPASESGLIKAGDRIINVTVSFTNIVYEDALTILSYASPYDVQLEIERVPDKSRNIPATPSGSKRLGSCSFNKSGQTLFHPLYRSQSIDDLTQIDKDTFPSHGIGPRRSQSVGVAAHKLAAHFKNSDSKLENKDRGVSSLLSTTGSLNEKMLANVMGDGSGLKNGLQLEKRFEDTLDSDNSASNNDTQLTNLDVSKNSNKTTGILKTSRSKLDSDSSEEAVNMQNLKQNSIYSDSPHQRAKLEPFVPSSGKRNEHSNVESEQIVVNSRMKVATEAAGALWQQEQSSKEESDYNSSRNSQWNQSKRKDQNQSKNSTPILKSKKAIKREDDNDSDVSNDSLEVSNRKRGRKSKKAAPLHMDGMNELDHNSMENNISSHRQKASKRNVQQAEVKVKSHTTDSAKNHSNNTERVYANNIINKSTLHGDEQNSASKEYQEFSDSRHYDRKDADYKATVYANQVDLQDKISNSRNVQNINIVDPSSNYSKVNGRNAYGEKQKLSSTENYAQNYGCTNKISINGDNDEFKNRSANSVSTFATISNYQRQAQEESSSTEDFRFIDKNKPNVNQKFAKKSTHPAGMFTQINPFQQPSRQKNPNFKVWTGREEISKDSVLNGSESLYNTTATNSYMSSNDSSHTNRRDYVPETQNYGQRFADVPKTVLISSYDGSSARSQNSPLSYRQHHK